MAENKLKSNEATLTISSNGKGEHDNQPSLSFEPYPHTDDNNNVAFTLAVTQHARNPLTIINLAVDLLESATNSNDRKIYIDLIKRGSVRINRLITELIEYNQADRELEHKYSIHQLLDEAIDLAHHQISAKNVAVKRDYASEDFKIVLNRSKMQIALNNIINNAIEAMAPDKGELRLVTHLIDHICVVQIEDNGCGICKKNLKYIFEPFFTNKPDGYGFGLAKTYDILRANHVGVNIESEEGEGTCFILLFDKKYPRQIS